MTKIKKATQKQMIAAFHSGDFSEVDRIDDIARQQAANIFLAVASGSVSLVWYDMPPVRCQSGAAVVHDPCRACRAYCALVYCTLITP